MLKHLQELLWNNPAIFVSAIAVIVSCAALLFGIASFYWMNWRKGKLRVSGPQLGFGAHGSKDGHLVIIVPIVFFNDGASPIIVEDLRLFFLTEADQRPLRFTATLADLKVRLSEVERKLPTQFPVRGREAIRMICEFQRTPGRLLFEERVYPIELRGRLDQNSAWIPLCRFDLNISAYCLPQINQIIRTYHLDPESRGSEAVL